MFNFKAAIFDMDGTLIDSMYVWEKIDMDYLKMKGLCVPSDLRENIEHLSFIECACYFKKRFNLTDSVEKIMDDWNNMAYFEYSNKVELKPGAAEFLKRLKLAGIKVGLATSNCTLLLEAALKNNKVYDYFDEITQSDEVGKSKENPDIYLLAAKKLGVNPDECVVFEDILPAVKGAKKAGMKVVGVYDKSSDEYSTEIEKNADMFIYKYAELKKAI